MKNVLKYSACASSYSDITNGFMITNQLGTCCIFLVFVAENTKAIVDYLLDKDIDVRLLMLIFLLPLILINWVRISCLFANVDRAFHVIISF